MPVVDEITQMASAVFDDKTMKNLLPSSVYQRHKENLVSGAPTSEDDMKVLAETLFKWGREQGAVSFAHWFFPMRGGSGAVARASSLSMSYRHIPPTQYRPASQTRPPKSGPHKPLSSTHLGC